MQGTKAAGLFAIFLAATLTGPPALLWSQVSQPIEQDATSRILAKLSRKDPLGEGDSLDLQSCLPSLDLLHALLTTFEQTQADESLEGRQTKEIIASTLIRIGVKDDRYFQLLSRYAVEAIEDKTPLWYVYNENGDAMRGKMSPEFLNWCKENGQDPKQVAAKQMYGHSWDMQYLGESGDPRVTDILKRGLQSTNQMIVLGSIHGLTRLGDSSTLPLVLAACEHLSRLTASVVAEANLAYYFTPEADAAMARLIVNPAMIPPAKRGAALWRDAQAESSKQWAEFWQSNPQLNRNPDNVMKLAAPMPPIAAPEGPSADRPVPTIAAHVLYDHFFHHLLALDHAAREHDKAGRNGNEVRAYYQNMMKLTDAEAATMKQIARDCLGAIHEVDLKARKVIAAAGAYPASSDEIGQLDGERIAAIEAHIHKLEVALGPASFRRVDESVRNVFANHVSVTPIPPAAAPLRIHPR